MAVAFGVLLLNIRIALRALSSRTLVLTTRVRDRSRSTWIAEAFSRSARRWRPSLALLFGLYASSQWQEWLLFRHAQPFGEVDPVLGKDIGFYIFRLPFLDVLRGYCSPWSLSRASSPVRCTSVAGDRLNLVRADQIADVVRGIRCRSGEAPPGRARRRPAARARVRRLPRRAPRC